MLPVPLAARTRHAHQRKHKQMTDNDDIFGLALERESVAQADLPHGLIVPGVIPGADLLTVETTMRVATGEFPTSGLVIFVENEDPDDPNSPEVFGNALEWQRAMKWPRLPTVAEALAYAAHDCASVSALVHYAVQDLHSKPAPPDLTQPDRGLFGPPGGLTA
jgi:hypothetical protein